MNWFLDVVFPKKCVGCGRVGKYICEKCDVGLWEKDQICPVCARNSRYGLRHSYCHKAWSLDGLIAFWAYDGVAKKLIKKAKYKFFYDYLSELIQESGQLVLRPEFKELAWFLNEKPTVVPVPLHPKRLKMRGFNQAELIGNALAKIYNLSCKNLLSRIKDTHQQVGRIRIDRLQNMQDAFQVNFQQVPQNVLLIDDVWTTGATLSECCATLKKSGVKKVWGLVLAR